MIDYGILITGGVSLLTGTVSSCITWLLARRKYNSEVDLNLVEKMEKSLKFYESLSDDNAKRLEEVTKRNASLEKEVQELRKQVLDLSVNICMDLACAHRTREVFKNTRKSKDRLDETPKNIRNNGASIRKKVEEA